MERSNVKKKNQIYVYVCEVKPSEMYQGMEWCFCSCFEDYEIVVLKGATTREYDYVDTSMIICLSVSVRGKNVTPRKRSGDHTKRLNKLHPSKISNEVSK